MEFIYFELKLGGKWDKQTTPIIFAAGSQSFKLERHLIIVSCNELFDMDRL
jgi:hypothetical protein